MTGIDAVKIIKKEELDNAAVIILTVDTEQVDFEDAQYILKSAQREFPNQKVLVVPKFLNIHTVDKFVIRSLINELQDCLYKFEKTELDNAENGYKC